MAIRNDLLRRIIVASGGEVTRQTENGLLQDWLDTLGGAVASWYNQTTFQIYENKQIPEGEQINES